MALHITPRLLLSASSLPAAGRRHGDQPSPPPTEMGSNLASESTNHTLVSLGVHHGEGVEPEGPNAVSRCPPWPSARRRRCGGARPSYRRALRVLVVAPNPRARRTPHPLPQHRTRRHRYLNSAIEHLGHLMHGITSLKHTTDKTNRKHHSLEWKSIRAIKSNWYTRKLLKILVQDVLIEQLEKFYSSM